MSANPLLSEIEDFLGHAGSGLTETRFGILAVNDGKFVPELRRGRRVWPETAERVRCFMRDFGSGDAAAPIQDAAA